MTSQKHCLGLQSCQQEGLSKFRDVRSKPDQEKVASSEKGVKERNVKDRRVPRDHAVNGSDRRSSFVPIGSPFSL